MPAQPSPAEAPRPGSPAADAPSSSLQAPQNGIKVFAMRHGNRKAKLNRPADQRKALIRSLTTEVLRHGKIKTTTVRVPGRGVAGSALVKCGGVGGEGETWRGVPLGCSRALLAAVQVRAKAIRKYVDKMITLAKQGTLHARRQVRLFHRCDGGAGSLAGIRGGKGSPAAAAVVARLQFGAALLSSGVLQ